MQETQITEAWTFEPNHLEFEYKGYPCVVHRVPDTLHLCGYVGVSSEHSLYKIEDSTPVLVLAEAWKRQCSLPADNEQLSMLTLIDALAGELPGENEAASPGQCLRVHGGITYARDYAPECDKKDYWWFGFDCAHCYDIIPGSTHHFPNSTYRTVDFVKEECQKLVDQLIEVR